MLTAKNLILTAILVTTLTSSLSAEVVLPADAPAQLLFARMKSCGRHRENRCQR